jgi:hypothetical protein
VGRPGADESVRGRQALSDEPRIEEKVQKIRIQQHPSAGLAWFGGWLFTIGFLHLGFWKGVLALFVWPYFLGVHFTALTR